LKRKIHVRNRKTGVIEKQKGKESELTGETAEVVGKKEIEKAKL
jgi:hypothetical protein